VALARVRRHPPVVGVVAPGWRFTLPAMYSASDGARKQSRTWKLREAAACGNIERVQAEIAHAIDINDGGLTGWTALHKASDRGRGEVVRELLEAGSNPDLKTKDAADTALHLAAANGHTDVCNELVKVGANVNAVNKIGWTPLHAAMYADKLDIARILTRAGASASAPNSSGVAPNMLAHRSDAHQVDAITESAKHVTDLLVLEPRNYQAIRDHRMEASKRDVDTHLNERRQADAAQAQLKVDRRAQRFERQTQLHFALDASLRGSSDVLDSGLDYHNLTPADVPNCHIASQVRMAYYTDR
jgi:hypothetical protein